MSDKITDTQFIARKFKQVFNDLAELNESDVELIVKAILKTNTLKGVMPVLAKLSNNIKVNGGKVYLSNELYKDLAAYDIAKHTYSKEVINDCLKSIE